MHLIIRTQYLVLFFLLPPTFCFSQDDVLLFATAESAPGSMDGELKINIQNIGNGAGQNMPPFEFRLVKDDEQPVVIQNNTGIAEFNNLGYDYYCLTVISGSGCFANACFYFDEPCSSDGCLISGFDANFTADGCTIQFNDWSNGQPTSWAWDFGDGAASNSQNPSHTYSASGCYYVTLEVSDGATTREITKEVCITACTDDDAPPPECQINGPTVAAAGQTVTLNAAATGIGPFTYQWSIPSSVTISPDNIHPNISATLPIDANNGEQFNFSVSA